MGQDISYTEIQCIFKEYNLDNEELITFEEFKRILIDDEDSDAPGPALFTRPFDRISYSIGPREATASFHNKLRHQKSLI